ncbi:hypothetical protein HG537_0C03410 [Torulaspora globosa]|uniref:BZIP domain-containing protein n=1 Tax=Torulaspora globosa TaxID=48254 RepID=A0A7H9HQY0_9SACH|nr:hypothetical protein HG537_0C03410 [Torulaspora sp. CBS 2947]
MSEKTSSSFINLFGADNTSKTGGEEDTVSQSAESFANAASMDTDTTPSILLEQLAYVDNFMSSLENDYATLDSWILGENQDVVGGRSLGLDERLATELSAFADDSFIFPDEDKRQQAELGDGEDDGDGSDGGRDEGNESGGRSHFLTQRRNTFLTSQYDHSKSRFSSRRRREREPSNGGDDLWVPSPVQDHGGFVNVDITPNGSNGLFAPTVRSPLTNLVASQPYSVSNSPESVGNKRPSSTKEEPLPAAADRAPVIHMPDYSKIPTSTLVALLPKVAVPPGAYQALINQGLGADQIDAIAVIIAHHEKEKQRQKSSGVDRGAGTNGSGIERSASFLFDILSNITQSQRSPQSSSESSSVREKSPVRRGSSSMLNEMTEDTQSGPLKRTADEMATDSESATEDSRSSGKWKAPKPVPNSRTAQKLPLKRKAKETQLETSIQELSELATSLQQKIHTLETENEVLKKLVISSGELEGIEKAEKIKTELLKQLNDKQKKSDEPDDEPGASHNDTII